METLFLLIVFGMLLAIAYSLGHASAAPPFTKYEQKQKRHNW